MQKNKYKLQYLGSYDQNGNLDFDKLKTELGKIQGDVTITDSDGGFPVIITIGKYSFTIDSSGNVELEEPQLQVNDVKITKAEDGTEIPADGIDEGTQLKITFTVSIQDGIISNVTPGTLSNGQVTFTTNGTEKEVTFTITGKVGSDIYSTQYSVSLEGYYKEPKPITAEDIVNSDNKGQYYGAIVTGYECENSEGVEKWKIFYADSDNIYLIANDYISYKYAPKGKGGTSLNKDDTDYRLYFTAVIQDYVGSSDITDAKIKALNNDYFTKGYASTSNNMKAVAYMLDTNVWSVFAGDKAEYAIGGPTVEMFMNSYNQKYNVDYRAQASSSMGYQISNNGGVNWVYSFNEGLLKNDSLYVITNEKKGVRSMWLASPSAYGDVYLMGVGYHAMVGTSGYSNYYGGFRPLVCLNSNVQLEKSPDGTYVIK